jgi:hypothetical protein
MRRDHMKRIVSALIVAVSLCPSSGWSAERPASIRGIRALGMGDAFTAVADDQNVFFYNPAGSTQRTGSLVTIIDLPVTIGTDLMDAVDFIDANENKLTNFNTLTPQEQANLINDIDRTISKLNPHLGVGLPNTNYLSGPIGNGWHWGTGGFGQVEGSFRMNTGLIPSLDYDVNADVIIPVNVAKRFKSVWKAPGQVGVGINLKYVQRNQIKEDNVSFLQLEDFSAPQMQKAAGFGADLGLLYQPNQRWNIGLTSLDFLGTSLDFDAVAAEKGFTAKAAHKSSVKPRWNAGFAWTPGRLGLSSFGVATKNRLLLAMDVKDLFNADSKVFFGDGIVADTAWTHLYLGAEYRWWFLRFRGGANQGYPTFGLGLDIPFLKLDYAYYSDELGHLAGTVKQSNHMLSLAFRFGSGKTEARARIGQKEEAVASTVPVKMEKPAMETPAETPAAEEVVPVENVTSVEGSSDPAPTNQ